MFSLNVFSAPHCDTFMMMLKTDTRILKQYRRAARKRTRR
jgi:hypothetical protein